MLPKSKLGRKMMDKLKLQVGAEHPHQAQQPMPLTPLSGRPAPAGALFAPPPVPREARKKTEKPAAEMHKHHEEEPKPASEAHAAAASSEVLAPEHEHGEPAVPAPTTHEHVAEGHDAASAESAGGSENTDSAAE